MPSSYSELKVRTHVVGIERLEPLRWRVSVDGRRLFTFCSESRARSAGRLEAHRLDLAKRERLDPRTRRSGP
ncbi:hypothetical protein AnaeK_0791 [Anaeromyxobacter sp. K]|uniref:hypothetical protein n=1 Tax=Anaeromyxobacter sp. (strain K) TaxID=447217 RepID=UPI00015F9E04|nr:hypothetical protein [Anaeromyxobacter sp. K]ACG72027.1 hypothetical protein AnaeK_0791 [Anaeromyxobacter sp. K]